MKKLLIAILLSTPLLTHAQSMYLSGGYVMDRPSIRDGIKENGIATDVNGSTQVNKIRQNGFYAGLGTILKPKKTSTFGLRIEAAYERHGIHLERMVTAQTQPFMPQETFPANVSANNDYLRLTPTISYVKQKKNSRLTYVADLGLTQMIHLGGYAESSSYLAVHGSVGLQYSYFTVRAGAEAGMQNTLGGQTKDYEIYSKRFFAGLNFNFIDAFGLKKKTTEEQPPEMVELKDQ